MLNVDFPQAPAPAGPRDALLMDAWEAFHEYDRNANRLQGRFRALQMWILLVGVLAVLFVALQQQAESAALRNEAMLATEEGAASRTITRRWGREQATAHVLHWVVVALPLVLSGLIAAAQSFRPGDKWVLLRGAAEAVKRQIFLFRAGTGDYAATGSERPERLLFERITAINERLQHSEVTTLALIPAGPAPVPENDDGLSPLTPADYLRLRVDDQLAFFTRRAMRFDREITRGSIAVIAFGAAGTWFAARSWEMWVPVATVIATSVATYLRYTQSHETLGTYNRARLDLKNIRTWWAMLTPEEQRDSRSFTTLVEWTERTLEEETAGWSQRMTDALSKLHRTGAERDEAEPGAKNN